MSVQELRGQINVIPPEQSLASKKKESSLREQLSFSSAVFGLVFVYLLLSFVLVCKQDAQAQQLYAYGSGKGVITFTTVRPEGKAYWVVKPKTPLYSSFVDRGRGYRWCSHPVASKYDDLILTLSRNYQLEPALVKAVMHVESAFNSGARSSKGAMGLMQLMPDTARRFGIQEPYRPLENVVGGVRYLRWLFEHFDGNVRNVLAGYNAGENAVHKYNGIPPYTETQDYVRRVLELRDRYRGNYSGTKG